MSYTKILPWANVERDTPEILFRKVLQLVQRHGHYNAAGKIMDYALPETYDTRQFTRYEFDYFANVNKGGSEGIYIDCYLSGKFDDSDKNRCKIGTFKTLNDDVAAYKIMGELSGLLVAYADMYVNENIDRYSSETELEHHAKYTSTPELFERFNRLFDYPAYHTTKGWAKFICEQVKGQTYQAFLTRFEELIVAFESVNADFGKEVAEAIYHNIHNNPPAPVLPENMNASALHLKNGGSLDALRWINYQ